MTVGLFHFYLPHFCFYQLWLAIFCIFRVFNPLVAIFCIMTKIMTPLNSLFVLGNNFYFLYFLIWWTLCKFIFHIIFAVEVNKYRNTEIQIKSLYFCKIMHLCIFQNHLEHNLEVKLFQKRELKNYAFCPGNVNLSWKCVVINQSNLHHQTQMY